MRRKELVDLIWEQIDLDNSTILVRGKGKKERVLPLHPIVLPLFQECTERLSEQQNHYSEPIFYRLGCIALTWIFVASFTSYVCDPFTSRQQR
jgi:integrase